MIFKHLRTDLLDTARNIDNTFTSIVRNQDPISYDQEWISCCLCIFNPGCFIKRIRLYSGHACRYRYIIQGITMIKCTIAYCSNPFRNLNTRKRRPCKRKFTNFFYTILNLIFRQINVLIKCLTCNDSVIYNRIFRKIFSLLCTVCKKIFYLLFVRPALRSLPALYGVCFHLSKIDATAYIGTPIVNKDHRPSGNDTGLSEKRQVINSLCFHTNCRFRYRTFLRIRISRNLISGNYL